MTSRALKQSYFLLFGLSDTSSTELLKSNGRFLWSNLQAAFRWSIQSDFIQIIIIPSRLPHVTIHVVETYLHERATSCLSTQHCWCWSGWWFLQPSVKLLRSESPPTIYDQICKQCGCEFNDHLPILMFFFKVRSPSSGSLQKLHSGNRCTELRTLTWKQTKH